MKKWYISCNFNPLQVEKIARLCTVLEQNQQMLLCGKNLCSNGVMTKEHYQKIDTAFERYRMEKDRISPALSSVMQRGICAIAGCDSNQADWILEEEGDCFDQITRLRMKFLLAYLLKRPEKADRIQFFSMPDIRFSTAYGISTRPEPYDLFMWYQTDADRVG